MKTEQQKTVRSDMTREQVESFGAELEQIRARVMGSLGEEDARYVRHVRSLVRWTGLGGRVFLLGGYFPPSWLAGSLLLAVSKILENMELGHNVMHGQYDFMNDPEFHSQTYEWDAVCPARAWRHSHNFVHHTFTNVLGRDRDVGYGAFRLFPEQPWHPGFLAQPVIAVWLAIFFEWGVAFHDIEFDQVLRGKKSFSDAIPGTMEVAKKAARQVLKDYVVFPVLAGPSFVPVLLGNAVANVVRNVWAFSIIFCGHFTSGVETFPEDTLVGETRAEWYLRQLAGSGNLEGGPVFHLFAGNLSHQIEHHLFPDLPAHRYASIAGDVRRIAAKYGRHYETGSFGAQLSSVLRRILRHSLPRRLPGPLIRGRLGALASWRQSQPLPTPPPQ